MQEMVELLVQEFQIKRFQVENTIKLIDEGNTIPFIARYRKEMTGELSDTVLRELVTRLEYLRSLMERKQDVKKRIEAQEKWSKDIEVQLKNASTLQEVEDIYRPFRPKRKTRASVAREQGLEGLAQILMEQDPTIQNMQEVAKSYICAEKGVDSIEKALQGAMDIVAEELADDPKIRKLCKDYFYETGILVSKAKQEESSVYDMYYEYQERLLKIPSHRYLALNRGEKEGYLDVNLQVNDEQLQSMLVSRICKKKPSDSGMYVKKALLDAYQRLLIPAIIREVRNQQTEVASENAIKVFSENLKHLLLQAPLKGKVVLGLDPAYRTGCKLAVVDETGKVFDTAIIYPTPPQNDVERAQEKMRELIDAYRVDIIAIGNGTASKEAEFFVSELLQNVSRKVQYAVVNEAGASVYSASKVGADEFPHFDVAKRSAISIARRLQDPLAELVKIEPKAIGVGQYQHDLNQNKLTQSLGGVVEAAVNEVGVDLNTASSHLLAYIAGINAGVAKNIVDYREQNGKFKTRKQLLKVPKLGEKCFLQCAGFLRISDGDNRLDNTAVHPESYEVAEKLLSHLHITLKEMGSQVLESRLGGMDTETIEAYGAQLGIGIPTLKDMIEELKKPGRDPREELPKPILLTEVMRLEDLKPGMRLTGTVRNVSDFGAFVDIGVHQDGLVHISELSDKFVKRAMDIVRVGDVVEVRVVSVDIGRKRISLSMKSNA